MNRVTERATWQSLTCAATSFKATRRMELEAIGGAASIALLGSATFALTARAWIALCHGRAGRHPFSQLLLPESAQRFRTQLELLGSKQAALLASALVFALLFVFAWLSGARHLLDGADTWLLAATGAIVVAAIGWGTWRLAKLYLLRRRVAYLSSATIAVGQALEKVGGDLNRVFHDVACGNGIVDHVLVGQKGVYAIFVVARRPGRRNVVRARELRLWFAREPEALPLEDFLATAGRLARMLGKTIGSLVRVRTVLVVPGWEVEEQSDQGFLVVNERSLGMLRGWSERSEYLMNEDVETLHDMLAERSITSGRRPP